MAIQTQKLDGGAGTYEIVKSAGLYKVLSEGLNQYISENISDVALYLRARNHVILATSGYLNEKVPS